MLDEAADTVEANTAKERVEHYLKHLSPTITCRLCNVTTKRKDWGFHLRDAEHLRRVGEGKKEPYNINNPTENE